MRGPVARRRARWIDIGAGLVVLAVLIGVGRIAMFGRDDPPRSQQTVHDVATHPTAFTSAEQRIVGLLPPGYSAAACARAANPFPNAIASLDCNRNSTYARFTLYGGPDALTGGFQATADGMALSACPGGNPWGPGTWSIGSSTGRIVCGAVADRANIAWTRDAQLLLATVNGGSDLGSLYLWWQRYGVLTQH